MSCNFSFCNRAAFIRLIVFLIQTQKLDKQKHLEADFAYYLKDKYKSYKNLFYGCKLIILQLLYLYLVCT